MNSLLSLFAFVLLSTCVLCKDREVTMGDYKLEVKGHSGKIRIGMTKPRQKGFTLEFDELTELDEDGDPVKCQGHSYKNFAKTDFTFQPDDKPIDMDFENINTAYFNISATLRENAVFTAHIHLFKENGSYSMNGEEVSVLVGDLKINIQLEGWQWCGVGSGEDPNMKGGKPGKSVEITVKTKGKGDGDKPKKRNKGDKRKNGRKASKNAQEYDMGDDTVLVMSNKVVVDDKVEDMDPVPAIVTKGTKTLVTMTFPKGGSIFYDPVAQLADGDMDSGVSSLALSLLLVVMSQLLTWLF